MARKDKIVSTGRPQYRDVMDEDAGHGEDEQEGKPHPRPVEGAYEDGQPGPDPATSQPEPQGGHRRSRRRHARPPASEAEARASEGAAEVRLGEEAGPTTHGEADLAGSGAERGTTTSSVPATPAPPPMDNPAESRGGRSSAQARTVAPRHDGGGEGLESVAAAGGSPRRAMPSGRSAQLAMEVSVFAENTKTADASDPPLDHSSDTVLAGEGRRAESLAAAAPGLRWGGADAHGASAVGGALEHNALPRMLRLQRAFESNMRHLYSSCSTHVAEWPALAIEWMPDRKFEDPERDYSLQYFAVGTQTIGNARNQLRVMEVAVPDVVGVEVMYGLYGDDDVGPSGGDVTRDPEIEIDPGKLFQNVRGHFRCDQAITLDAAVLKIRAMPIETNIIAVTTATGFVGVFNLVQEQQDDSEGFTVPDAILSGHSTGGFGLSWNTVKPGYLASGADDGFVNYWDVSHCITVDLKEEATGAGGQGQRVAAPDASGSQCQPIQKLTGHRDTVTDVSWHGSQGHLLASSSMDGDLRIWDTRLSNSSLTIAGAHTGGATAAQFHPVGAFQLASAGVDGQLAFWDIRRPQGSVLELGYHGRSVTGVQWAPFHETVIASYSEDGRVVVWDLGKTSLPLEYSADALAPPEVSFVHMGHLGFVTDISWCPGKNDDWLMASTDSMNGVHVYRPKQSVVMDYLPEELW